MLAMILKLCDGCRRGGGICMHPMGWKYGMGVVGW